MLIANSNVDKLRLVCAFVNLRAGISLSLKNSSLAWVSWILVCSIIFSFLYLVSSLDLGFLLRSQVFYSIFKKRGQEYSIFCLNSINNRINWPKIPTNGIMK